jgi:hypothetical protein
MMKGMETTLPRRSSNRNNAKAGMVYGKDSRSGSITSSTGTSPPPTTPPRGPARLLWRWVASVCLDPSRRAANAWVAEPPQETLLMPPSWRAIIRRMKVDGVTEVHQ